ncbi:type VI secretion system tube protein Hcp, partial [Planktotalea sp.]|uniref:type VI secretion system tube protein Hcp n=1 Tax=Planktotalea sp. TaxID=2029877 RepID=UPI003299913B
MPTTYFLLIDGIAGDSAIPGFEGWFDLDAFSLGQSHSGTTHFGANGGAGRLNVQDLSVSLSGNAGLTSLLNSTSMGSHIDAIQIVGISSNDQAIVYELTLNDIMTTSVSEESAQNNVPILDVTFNFGQFGLVTTTQNQDGSLGGQQSYGYDTTTNEVIDPATLDEPTPSRAVLASNPTTYYLLIDGIAGDSTDEGYEGWFKLDAFNLGQSQSGTTHTGPGDGAGRVDIQDLSVELSGNTGLADFLNGSATGIYLDALQIEGVTRRDATVYQLTLNDILVTSVNETTEPNGASSLDVAFNFSQIGLVTTGQNPDGSPASPGTEQSYGWNLVDNTYLDPATLDAPTSLPAFGNSAPTTYFLSIDGIAGDSTARGFEGWFELDGFNLGQSQAATTHTGAGAVSVRDLSIALSGNAGLTSLLNSTSLGAHIEAIQIVGISGNDQAIVYELTLNDI